MLTVHHTPEQHPFTGTPDIHQDTFSKTVLGFWMYLMTDCVVFATLFATYAVLHNNTFGGPSSQELFHLPTVFSETMVLLFSSVACGLAVLAAVRDDRTKTIGWLGATFILGAVFLTIELKEFSQLIQEGNSWTRSAFLSSFFTLVGTHGLHITIGLFWLMVMAAQIFLSGVTKETFRRLVLFSMFWHFLDLIWIFIFTFVYLAGVI